MKQEEIKKTIEQQEVSWNCRYHPTNWWHEVGCPHQEWTKEELLDALVTKKKFEQSNLRGQILT